MAPATAATGWTLPVQGAVTSGYGPRWGSTHKGIDMAAATGTPARADSARVMRSASWNGGYGNTVVIDYENGVSTLYAHNSALTVTPGQRAQTGEGIAKAGSTGNSTGPHLHSEVKVGGDNIDPCNWLAGRGMKI
jgi:murein DD-endopeptidase MepM/ murein hydrolase activator NlpD